MSFLLKWQWEFLSLVAGLLLTFSFAPFNYSYLAVISLIIVCLSWIDCSPVRAALRGFFYGLGLFGSGVYWVYISIHDFGGAPAAVAVLLTGFFVIFCSLFSVVTGYISAKITEKKYKHRRIWVIPFVWVLIEYGRGNLLLNGFPWLQIAYTQIETPLKGFVPIVGVNGTGFLLALTATLLVAGFKRQIKYLSAWGAIIFIWGGGFYLQTVKWTKPIDGAIINVALIQGNIAQDKKWLPENRIKTLLSYQQLTEENWGVDIIVWPETAVPAYLSQVKEVFLTPLSIKAKAQKTDIILGLPARGEGNKYYNAVITLGSHEGRYHKSHLLPFGEYLPLQPLSGFVLDMLNIPLGNFTAGTDDQKLLIAGGYPFSTSICYEDAFGDELIRTQPEATFLVNVTNDAWFGNSSQPHQHMQIAQMRALETGRYMLRATNTGVTGIISPEGLIINKAPMFKQAVLKGKISPMQGITPYAKLGDGIILLMLSVCLVGLVSIKRSN